MTFKIVRGERFNQDLAEFGAYGAEYSLEWIEEQVNRIDYVIDALIARSPMTWTWFVHTGAPYRAYLFRVGRRTRYWIVYRVDQETETVNLLRFWNGARDPTHFSL